MNYSIFWTYFSFFLKKRNSVYAQLAVVSTVVKKIGKSISLVCLKCDIAFNSKRMLDTEFCSKRSKRDYVP